MLERVVGSASTVYSLKRRVASMYGLLAIFNIGTWIWAWTVLHSQSILLGTALVAYSFGLRHAVDADHIAAIDNVTRKLMQDDKRPVTVGFFFALGHSAVVVLVACSVAMAAAALQQHVEAWKSVGGVISTGVSALFLFLVATMNVLILRGVWAAFCAVRKGEAYNTADIEALLSKRGLLARLFNPLFRMVTGPAWMLPLGFLFGLGFDTATEVTLLGMSASQAQHGYSMAVVLVFPALFAAGMSLVDTTDGILMLGAYEWAFVKPLRRLYYNVVITALSVLVAVMIGGIETLSMFSGKLGLEGRFWSTIQDLNGNFNSIGFAIVGLFIVAWAASYIFYRLKNYDRLDNVQA